MRTNAQPTPIPYPMPASAVTPDPVFAKSELYTRMLRVNSGLRSYESHVHLAIALHTFPFLSPTLEGTVYYKAPDKNAIVFDEVPAFASLFKKVFPRLDPPASWPALYSIHQLSHANGMTQLRLEPKKKGTITHIDLSVDDATAFPVSFTYNYRNGGFVHFDQTAARVNGAYLVTKLNGHVELPSTTADANSTFSRYHVNVPIKETVFASPSP